MLRSRVSIGLWLVLGAQELLYKLKWWIITVDIINVLEGEVRLISVQYSSTDVCYQIRILMRIVKEATVLKFGLYAIA